MESVELENKANSLIEVYSNDLSNDRLSSNRIEALCAASKIGRKEFFQIVRMKMIDSMIIQFVRSNNYTGLLLSLIHI